MQHRAALLISAFVFSRALAAQSAAPAADDAQQQSIQDTLPLCAACHGEEGRSLTPEWPSLAGQHAEYLVEQLQMLRDSRRYDSTMTPMARTLSDGEITALADYYSRLALPEPRAAANDVQLGKALYEQGRTADGIQACRDCHGAEGRGDPAVGAPAVRGQNAAYSQKQLEMYAAGTRYRAPDGKQHDSANAQIMNAQARNLTKEEIQSIAAYLESMR
jgi:cytochrome c553